MNIQIAPYAMTHKSWLTRNLALLCEWRLFYGRGGRCGSRPRKTYALNPTLGAYTKKKSSYSPAVSGAGRLSSAGYDVE